MATDKERIDKLEADIKALTSAFLKDDDGSPDFIGHRIFHKTVEEEAEDNRRKKADVATNITTWAVTGLITVLITLLAQNWPALSALIVK